MTLALPEAYFEVEAKARAVLRIVTEFRALVRREEERSSPSRTDQQLVARVRNAAKRLYAQSDSDEEAQTIETRAWRSSLK
jgi:hypothetical protein